MLGPAGSQHSDPNCGAAGQKRVVLTIPLSKVGRTPFSCSDLRYRLSVAMRKSSLLQESVGHAGKSALIGHRPRQRYVPVLTSGQLHSAASISDKIRKTGTCRALPRPCVNHRG
jgi:hypothetical protein